MTAAARRDRRIPLALVLGSFALAVLQHPGRSTADTKVDLHVAPAGFLADVASVWSGTGDLGHVQGGQYGGYLFPMGPWFAAGHGLGLPDWLVHRLWLGLLLALAAWGTVRLLDALLPGPRGAAHAVAGAAMVLNPYTVVFANRTSVTLLGYAALPWLLLAVHRGLREPRGWRWPAAFALVVAASGGGVNAAVVGWLLVAPALLALYEPAFGGVAWRDVRGFAGRALAATLAASAWWMVPVLAQALYGADFLEFIEQPGAIWATTSASEALRLMGYWTSYTGVGFPGHPRLPTYEDSGTMLFAEPVVAATLIVPALAIAGFAWTRRWRYGPFFLGLALVGVLAVMAGFPEGTPLRKALTFTYNRVEAVQFMRTTYKAAPLVALGLAGLLGAAAGEAWRRLGAARPAAAAVLAARPAAAAALAALLALAAWPLVRGDAVGLTNDGAPAAWRDAARDLDRDRLGDRRAVVLPGQLFAFYRWGGTVDPILPVLAGRPVTVRSIVPYGDPHATDLLWTTDLLVQQRRLYPGQLRPLLDLIAASAVVSGSDDDLARSGAVAPGPAARDLAAQGLARPDRAYGPRRAFADGGGGAVELPQVRRHDLPAGRTLVRLAPVAAPLVVDGSAPGLAALAALGGLPRDRALLYAGDLSAAELRRAAAAGAEVAITDSNRRQVLVNSLMRQNRGATLAADDPLTEDAAVLNPFPERGATGQTVAQLSGARYARAPFSPGRAQFPEHRPFAALDGDPATGWLADRNLEPARRWLEVGFARARDVPHVDVLGHADAQGSVTAVEVAGRRFGLRPGWNRLRLGLRAARSLRVRIAGVRATGRAHPPGGLRELRVPGLRAREALRVPRLAERALAGRDLSRTPLTYVLARTTGDEPLRAARRTGPAQARRVRDRADPETGLRRVLTPPAARAWRADGWASLSPLAPDDRLDRLAGYRGPARATSSGRFRNAGAARASSAFDGRPDTAWMGERVPGPRPWIAWRGPDRIILAELRFDPPPAGVPGPARVRLTWPGGATRQLPVARDGRVALDRPIRTDRFRLEVVAAGPPAGRAGVLAEREAVGIGEIRAPGLPRMAIPRAGRVAPGCGTLALRARGATGTLPLRVEATVEQLDRGAAMRVRGCGAPLALPAGRTLVTASAGDFRLDFVRLRSPAPRPGDAPAVGGGRVLDAGRAGRGARDGVRLAVDGPSWLILGESFNRGWRAWCGDRALGAPRVVDGHANGWRVDRSCREARFAFVPNRAAHAAYAFSAVAALALLAVLLLRRRRPPPAPAPLEPAAPSGEVARWPLRRAAAAGLAAGVVLGFVFAIRAGVAIAPAVTLLLWRGVPTRHLALAAGALVGLALPVLYVALQPADDGGFNFEYAIDLIAAHWVAVAALTLAIAALARELAARRRAVSTATFPSPAPGPPAAPGPAARP